MKYCKVCLTILILLNLSIQQALMARAAPNHVVPVEELHSRLATLSAQRMQNIQAVQKLLHHDLVQQEVGRLVDLEKVELALAVLDDKTLNELAIQSKEVNDQIEAGLSTAAWIVIIVAVLVFVLAVALFADG
jgi:hypothetical protein